jgi:large subunit ribosomal protein L2
MAIKKFRPTSPGRRFMTITAFDDVTKHRPERSLIESKKKNAGRNFNGHITVRHRGGGR